YPVAAHLRQRPVGVVVVHEPLRLAGQVCRIGVLGRADHPQDAVPAEAEAPVTQPPYQVSGHRQGAVRVGQDDEVVAGPVALGEAHADYCATFSAFAISPGSAASSHRTVRSRRNQERWRRTKRFVACTVSAAACCSVHSPARYRSTCWYPSARLAVRPSRNPAASRARVSSTSPCSHIRRTRMAIRSSSTGVSRSTPICTHG